MAAWRRAIELALGEPLASQKLPKEPELSFQQWPVADNLGQLRIGGTEIADKE
jgi:hypothetical protein